MSGAECLQSFGCRSVGRASKTICTCFGLLNDVQTRVYELVKTNSLISVSIRAQKQREIALADEC